MTSEGLGEMFEGDSADMYAGKFPLVSMGGNFIMTIYFIYRARLVMLLQVNLI